jgi:hypothetical protein
MKLTPFGFVSQTEGFLREALSLPPVGGGKWSLQRVINFTDQAGALQVLLDPQNGPQRVKMTFHARQTGTFKDSGIQGWIEFDDGHAKDPFVLKQSNSTRAAEEIYDIVDRALAQLPEWDNSAGISAPPPAPHSGACFTPLIPTPAANGGAPAPEATEAAADPQSFIDSILGANKADAAPTEEHNGPSPQDFSDPQSFVDSIFGSNNAADAPAAEPSAEAPAANDPQSFVDSIFNANNASDAPAAEASSPEPEASSEEPPAPEAETPAEVEPAKKPKATKAKKAKEPASADLIREIAFFILAMPPHGDMMPWLVRRS